MSDVIDITYNVTGQQLYADLPSRPASVTSVSVFNWYDGDDATAESATTGSAALDAADTTVDAATGKSESNPRQLNVNDTSDLVVGRQYLLTNSLSTKEWIEIVSIDAGNSATTRVPMYNDYANGDAVEGTRVTISIDATWVADKNNITDRLDPNPGYRVRWVWVDADSNTQVTTTFFDLVRVAGRHNVTPTDLELLLPGWIHALPPAHQEDRGLSLIDEAYEQFKIDLLQERIPDQQIRNQDAVDECVKRKAIVLLQEQRVMISGLDVSGAELARDIYMTRFDSLFRATSTAKVPIGTDDTGAGAYRSPVGITVR